MPELPTPDEILEHLRNGTAVLAVCLSAGGSLRPGYRRGFFCSLCATEVQMSERAQAQVAAGGLATCNPCGIALGEWAKKDGRLEDFIESPEARAAVERGRSVIDPERIKALRKV